MEQPGQVQPVAVADALALVAAVALEGLLADANFWVAVGMGAVVLVVLLATCALIYLTRESIVDNAIRDRLQSADQNSFSNDPSGIRVLLCGTGTPEPRAATRATA